jgi:hypothetical protein
LSLRRISCSLVSRLVQVLESVFDSSNESQMLESFQGFCKARQESWSCLSLTSHTDNYSIKVRRSLFSWEAHRILQLVW